MSQLPAAMASVAAVADAERVLPLSSVEAARMALQRDLRLAFRQRGQLVQPLAFFAMVTLLFPLAVSPELARLREMVPGVLWSAE